MEMEKAKNRLGALLALVFAVVMALCLAGCSSGGKQESSSNTSQEQSAAKDFDGSGLSDTGDGVMYISTAGGTSEDGNVPEIVGGGTLQISVNTTDMDGSVCTVYVDGMENSDMNAGAMTQQTITLKGDDTKPGEHTVELVKMDGDSPVIYKVATYKVAE